MAARSYGPADGDLFHGREAEGAALAIFFRDRPLAVLTAPSGMGKTSLLHAKVLPLLEKEHWLAVHARPTHDPGLSMRQGLVEYLLPDPEMEAAVVDRIVNALEPGQAVGLRSVLDWYGQLPIDRRIAYRLFLSETEDEFAPLPMICRALRGSIALHELIEHFEALVADGSAFGLTPHTNVLEFMGRLRDSQTKSLWTRWRSRLEDTSSLSEALARVQDEWLPLRPGLAGILFVLDQFEEMFTQLPVSEIERLLREVRTLIDRPAAAEASKPIHIAFSLRKEFFADLVPYLKPFGPVERLAFFLGPMPLEQARSALTLPAESFGITFAQREGGQISCVDRILALTVDDGQDAEGWSLRDDNEFVALPTGRRYAPILISLIGAQLWARLGVEPRANVTLVWEQFKKLVPNLENVFASFLNEALERIDPDQRFDALELLDRLVTPSGFRNVIAEEELLGQMPLNRSAAKQLLDTMTNEVKLIRRESRRGGRVVEVMHERLIAPVRFMLAEYRRKDILRTALVPAYDLLCVLPDEPDPTKDPLPSHFRDALFRYLGRLGLDFLTAKNLLRSLLVLGPSGERGNVAGSEQWEGAVQYLAGAMSGAQHPASGRMALLIGNDLDVAITDLCGAPHAVHDEAFRYTVISALADRTNHSHARIERVFTGLGRRLCDDHRTGIAV